jgi:MEDS: MEthanogen/methylotroph, DcmR Sensory domain/Histidine kinase-like ATPase domain
VPVEARVREPHDHVVYFYDDTEDLAGEVGRVLAEGLANGDAVVVVATRSHREAFDVALCRNGIDVARARGAGQYLRLDAAETLLTFMVDGDPDPERFRSVVGGMIARTGADGRRVRVFGEMVALLWDEGNVSAAIEVETLWNDLAQKNEFSLWCAYPMSSIAASDLTDAHQVCRHHSAMVAPSSYSATGTHRIPEPAATRSQVFVPVPLAPRAARRFVRETLRAWDEHELTVSAVLVISELATNAVVHANGPFRVSIRRTQSVVRIEVQDMSPQRPEQRLTSVDLTGRGIALVAQLSTRWGTDDSAHGKTVWVDLARDLSA